MKNFKEYNDENELDDLDDLTKQIIAAAEKWPNWKKEYYNNNFAISKHSTKLKLDPNERTFPMTTNLKAQKVTCDFCTKREVCMFTSAYKEAARIIVEFNDLGENKNSPIIANLSCKQFIAIELSRNPESSCWYDN